MADLLAPSFADLVTTGPTAVMEDVAFYASGDVARPWHHVDVAPQIAAPILIQLDTDALIDPNESDALPGISLGVPYA